MKSQQEIMTEHKDNCDLKIFNFETIKIYELEIIVITIYLRTNNLALPLEFI